MKAINLAWPADFLEPEPSYQHITGVVDASRKGSGDRSCHLAGILREQVVGLNHPHNKASEQEQSEIDGVEGSRSAGARMASCVEGSRVEAKWLRYAARLQCSRVSGL
ncbi:hypothetical protein NIBR502774_14170 (plasmid) [Rhizobium sp. NIBRBAC000502774]|nr:hypothetical protein NIBR502774_14170 [Rhizobium sp. NIBRBAC000502774]